MGAACRSGLPFFRPRLFVRLKANVIFDTQQEPSEHQQSAAAGGKKNKKTTVHLTTYPSNIQQDRWLWWHIYDGDEMEETIKSSEETKCGREWWFGGGTYWDGPRTQDRETMTNHRTVDQLWHGNNEINQSDVRRQSAVNKAACLINDWKSSTGSRRVYSLTQFVVQEETAFHSVVALWQHSVSAGCCGVMMRTKNG